MRSVMSERTGSCRPQAEVPACPLQLAVAGGARYAWPERAVCGIASVRDWSSLGGLPPGPVLRFVCVGLAFGELIEQPCEKLGLLDSPCAGTWN